MALFGKYRRYPIRAAKRKFFGARLAESEIPANLVLSPGGVATTFLMEYLAGFVPLNDPDDGDGLKHRPRLPDDILATRRILFLSGEPGAIYASIARRGWVRVQGAKLGSLACQLLPLGRCRRPFEAALASQVAFFAGSGRSNVLTIDYETLWERAADIAAHFGIEDPRFVAEFPPRRERKSRKQH